MADLFQLDSYLFRRKVFKLFGAGFHVFDDRGRVVAYSAQKAFKLKEDISVFTDEAGTTPLLHIQARSVIDFSSAYDIVDPREGRKVGAVRRKGWSSILRDTWHLLDDRDQPVAELKETSAGMALLSRFVTLIPQSFRLGEGSSVVEYNQHFNPFIYRLQVTISPGCTIDRRVVFATGVLIASIEGRQG